MSQSNKESYKTKESYMQMFLHSCLGKVAILLVILGMALLVAHITVPSDKKMDKEMASSIYKCIEENDSIHGDKIDDAVRNFIAIFTTADSTSHPGVMSEFHKYNQVRIYRHTFYSTARIHNNFNPRGTRVGIGIFGIVIPTVGYSDILMHTEPLRKEYNERIIKETNDDEEEDFGRTPSLDDYKTRESGNNKGNVRIVSE